MDFKDQIKQLGDRVTKLKEQILTEEATKNAFIMPFLQTLGYDVFNPLEVVPEYITDIGTKKGEKIDYAIFKEGNPTILVECKHWGQNLNLHDGQLLRYFHVSKAKFGLLTNGITYRFYSDLVESNKMDERPFLEFNITEIKDNQIEELKKFHKTIFDAESITNTASELKYTNELKQLLQQELTNPSADFVKHFARQVYPSVVTAKVLEQFTNLTKKSIQQHISDLITERLKTALTKEDEKVKEQEAVQAEQVKADENKIVTTEEELEGFMIVKTILRQRIDANRITHRDAQSYFAILLDNNNRKTICRLYLNSSKKYFATLDEQKKEVRNEITSLDDIFKYSELLLKIVASYDKSKENT
ncbi:MAG TPA: type I restriction enzyme HsdR N-terminal domain-containing protein [Saprospiraceae bacterium]|nr:type I restriction enzyme HsdR N-terminal domain-containing protein [Saprospiraceae bacterium]HNC32827.1 type I restriction enzyme HsdR N-terminal domain-containing protein [Bacteroidia bacterium]HMY83697.1 type I restriction enzyme HsdR N-terminal domain-containing protein [Saprospiraceae bacterium]HMZ23903.1 type I restriction enzyme HsdR N-terminal domain-containing protein [Saprospiraceae bacterium]HNA77389.1 type I restriction enzyme HsdR N-terminal domain-containing protein [Saprospira